MDARQEERYARQEGCLQNKNRLDVSRCGTECTYAGKSKCGTSMRALRGKQGC